MVIKAKFKLIQQHFNIFQHGWNGGGEQNRTDIEGDVEAVWPGLRLSVFIAFRSGIDDYTDDVAN